MTTRFPLVLLPKRVIYVDDQGGFLDILRKTMPKRLSREFIDQPNAALQALLQETTYWCGVESLLSRAHEFRSDGEGEAPLYVKLYFQDWRRFHLTGVLIVDYAMPGLDGVELLKQLDHSPARRVLLTGAADAEVAVKAFNSGLIQKFIPKSTPNLFKEIASCSDEMHLSVCEHMGHLIRSTLRTDQIELLHEPRVVRGLQSKVEELNWIEYVVVGQPFGLLGMAHSGPLQWLQLETPDSLRELAEAAEELEYPPADVKAIRDFTALAPREIRQQLQVHDNRQLVVTDAICTAPDVFAAVIDLPLKVMTAQEYGVDDIRSPDELMRSLLRDVQLAHRIQVDADHDSAREAFTEALSHLAATGALSEFHGQALHAAMAGMRIQGELAALVEAAVSAARRDGKKHGPRK